MRTCYCCAFFYLTRLPIQESSPRILAFIHLHSPPGTLGGTVGKVQFQQIQESQLVLGLPQFTIRVVGGSWSTYYLDSLAPI
jgi:hypothetical protein